MAQWSLADHPGGVRMTDDSKCRTVLTTPDSVHDLERHQFAGGVSEVQGYATFRGKRVYLQGVQPSGLVTIDGPMSLQDVPGLQTDHQIGSVSGHVPFDSLTRFWLIRTSHFDHVDERSPEPGLTAVIDGTAYGVTDTCGTVSEAGVRQLQLVWLGATGPDRPEWVLDGYGYWTTLVPRSVVDVVTYVEWHSLYDAHVAPVEWRAQVRESDLTGLRRISSTTRWRGESAAVNGANDTDDVVYVPGESVAWSELTELHSSAESITPDALPTRALAVAGQYKYSEYRL
jgi:hypothetical protein